MSAYDDLPLIQLRPGPSDAELEAQRDAKHDVEVAAWFREQETLDRLAETDEIGFGFDHIPPRAVIG